jgi:hypothetical protein
MWAELQVDVYDGPNCDQHRKYWNAYTDGDMQDDNFEGDLVLSLKNYPHGTKVTISIPECPKCYETTDTCNCGFDWKNWVEEQYS